MSNPLLARQAAIKSALQANAVLSPIPIITEDAKDALATALFSIAKGGLTANAAGKTGINILLLTISIPSAEANQTTMINAEVVQRVWLRELVAVNRDPIAGIGVQSLDAIVAIMQVLQGRVYASGSAAATPPAPSRPGASGTSGRGLNRRPFQFEGGASEAAPDLTTLDWYLDFREPVSF